jgi:hypothetical protein
MNDAQMSPEGRTREIVRQGPIIALPGKERNLVVPDPKIGVASPFE